MHKSVCILYSECDAEPAEHFAQFLSAHVTDLDVRLMPLRGACFEHHSENTLSATIQQLRHYDFLIPLLTPSLMHDPWIREEDFILALKDFCRPALRLQTVQFSRCLWYSHPVFRSISPLPSDEDLYRLPVNDPKWGSLNRAWTKVLTGLLKILQPHPASSFAPPETILVAEGELLLGSANPEDSNPFHKERVTAFLLSKYPVTVSDFAHFIKSSNYLTTADQFDSSYTIFENRTHADRGVNWRCNSSGFAHEEAGKNYPVIHISWIDACAYCNWLSRKTSRRWRLPSDIEWEYAARGGANSPHAEDAYSGGTDLEEYGWYLGNSEGNSQPVGLKTPNYLGLYEMSGNVFEWCSNSWAEIFLDSSTCQSPGSPNSEEVRVIRGGSWRSAATSCRVSYRSSKHQLSRSDEIGFRVVCDI